MKRASRVLCAVCLLFLLVGVSVSSDVAATCRSIDLAAIEWVASINADENPDTPANHANIIQGTDEHGDYYGMEWNSPEFTDLSLIGIDREERKGTESISLTLAASVPMNVDVVISVSGDYCGDSWRFAMADQPLRVGLDPLVFDMPYSVFTKNPFADCVEPLAEDALEQVYSIIILPSASAGELRVYEVALCGEQVEPISVAQQPLDATREDTDEPAEPSELGSSDDSQVLSTAPDFGESLYGSTLEDLRRYAGATELGVDTVLELWRDLPIPINIQDYTYLHNGTEIDMTALFWRVAARVESRVSAIVGEAVDLFADSGYISTYGVKGTFDNDITWVLFSKFAPETSRSPVMAEFRIRKYTSADTSGLEQEIEQALLWLLLGGDGENPWPGTTRTFRTNSTDLVNRDLVSNGLTHADYAMIALALELGNGADLSVYETLGNRYPYAIISAVTTDIVPSEPIQFDASESFDPDGDSVSYELVELQGTGDSQIIDGDTQFPQVIVQHSGDYVFELRVTDPTRASSTAQVVIYALADCPEPQPIETKNDLIVAAHYLPTWGCNELYYLGAESGIRSYDPTLGDSRFTSLLDSVDIGDPRIADWHIKMAVENGINCFLVGNSRPGSDWGPEVNIERGLLQSNYLDKIKFAMELNLEAWTGSRYFAGLARNSVIRDTIRYYCANYFRHPSYLHIEGRPVLYIYHSFGIRDVEGQDAYDEMISLIRHVATSRGFNPLIVGDCLIRNFNPEMGYLMVEPLDAMGGYGSFGTDWSFVNGVATIEGTYQQLVAGLEQEYSVFQEIGRKAGTPLIPNLMVGFSNREMFEIGYDNWHVHFPPPTAQQFRNHLEGALEFVDPELNMISIYAWNENHESGVLEPTHEYGFRFLEALRDVVGIEPLGGWPKNVIP